LLASLKAASNFCSGFPLLSLVDFLQGTFMAGCRNNFSIKSGYQKAGTSSMKSVTGRNFTLVSGFIESSRNLKLDFLHKKTDSKLPVLIARTLKKYSSRDTIPSKDDQNQ
jgi:hypothetical protein